jgi:hypothetical protein
MKFDKIHARQFECISKNLPSTTTLQVKIVYLLIIVAREWGLYIITTRNTN